MSVLISVLGSDCRQFSHPLLSPFSPRHPLSLQRILQMIYSRVAALIDNDFAMLAVGLNALKQQQHSRCCLLPASDGGDYLNLSNNNMAEWGAVTPPATAFASSPDMPGMDTNERLYFSAKKTQNIIAYRMNEERDRGLNEKQLPKKRLRGDVMCRTHHELISRLHHCIENQASHSSRAKSTSFADQMPIRDVFHLLDQNGDAFLSYDELVGPNGLLIQLGLKAKKAVKEEFLDALDTDGEGLISFEQIVDHVSKLLRVMDKLQASAKVSDKENFERYVVDHDLMDGLACTFNPSISATSRAIVSVLDDVPGHSGCAQMKGDFLTREADWSLQKNANRHKKEQELEDRALGECTFKPQINRLVGHAEGRSARTLKGVRPRVLTRRHTQRSPEQNRRISTTSPSGVYDLGDRQIHF